jgi:hypothetical protein
LSQVDSLIETLDIMRDDELMASIRLSRHEVAEGRVFPLDEDPTSE